MTTPVPVVWAPMTLPFDDYWGSISYGNGLFVVLSWSGAIITSPDGETWTLRSTPGIPEGHSLTGDSVTFGNGMFVAMISGFAATSPDGITWTLRTMPSVATWSLVTYGNGLFIVVSLEGHTTTSPDGITWTATALNLGLRLYPRGLAFGNGVYLCLAGGLSAREIVSSTDGQTWTQVGILPSPNQWMNLVFGNGVFVAVSASVNGGSNSTIAATSSDGITWTTVAMPAAANWYAVTFGDGRFVAIARSVDDGPSALGAVSTDGITWTGFELPALAGWDDVGYGNGRFIATSYWDAAYNSSHLAAVAVVVVPDRYLRMNQRDDGIGVERHPRLAGVGSNNPTSAQRGKPRRLGKSNTYL